MKNRLFHCILFFFLLNSQAFAHNLPGPWNNAPTSGCEAPTPAWITATNVTPTSVSLAWEASQAMTYYKCDAYDITGGFSLPTNYTTTPFFTWSNLTPEHTYQFDVRASYCEEGPYSAPVSTQVTTSSIIIDIVIELSHPCTPNISVPTGPNVTYGLCIEQSEPQTAPYTNAYIGSLQYDNKNVLNFGIAAVGSAAHIGPLNAGGGLPNQGFSFPSNSNHPSWAECLYNGTPVFRVDYLNFNAAPNNGTSVTNMSLRFFGTYGGYSYCPATNPVCNSGNERPGSESTVITPRSNDVAAEPQTWLSPNPFQETALLQYEVPEPSAVEIGLYDAYGRLIQTLQHAAQMMDAGSHEITLEGQTLPAGVYFLKTRIGNYYKVLRLVKQQ